MSKDSRVLRTGSNQITQAYKKGIHNGIDLVKSRYCLDDIIAHTDGKVVLVQTGYKNNNLASGMAAFGNCVKIDHGNGIYTLYAHLSSVSVKKGQTVKKGDTLGYMGNTGRSFGGHLHFEVFDGNTKIDPTPYIAADLPKLEPIPQKKDNGHAKYRVYAGKWYSEVTDYNNNNSTGYAGVQGKKMTALCAKSTVGKLKYRVHILGGGWLSWISSYNTKDSKTGYAGIKGKKIDAVQMKLEGTDEYLVKYRVSPTKGKTWYGWCTNTSNSAGDGYAGVLGNAIDCIQIDIVRK